MFHDESNVTDILDEVDEAVQYVLVPSLYPVDPLALNKNSDGYPSTFEISLLNIVS